MNAPALSRVLGRIRRASGSKAATPASRRSRAWGSHRVEILEGRALLSVAAVDPTFHGGQPVVNPTTAPSGTVTTLNTASAVAVQADGKVVVVGQIRQPGSSFTSNQVGVRRYNSDGTLDTTFGAGGEADITLPSATYNTVIVAPQVLIQGGGRIVLAAELAQSSTSPYGGTTYTSVETVAIRLNANGSADATFGTAGQAVISTDAAALTQIALQGDGRIVLGGSATPTGGSPELAATRLTADGATDSTFNGGNLLLLDPATYGSVQLGTPSLAGLFVTPAGKIALVGSVTLASGQPTYQVVEFNADGTVNTAFGANGIARGPSNRAQYANAAAIQADGKFLIAAGTVGNEVLTRLDAAGKADATFSNPALPFAPDSIAVQGDGKILLDDSTGGTFSLIRYTTTGAVDGSFGPGGQARFQVTPLVNPPNLAAHEASIAGVAFSAAGLPVVVGTATDYQPGVGTFGRSTLLASQLVVARLRAKEPVPGDYDGDGRADIAAQLSSLAQFAIRKSTGGDVVQVFGIAGPGQTIPEPGDYDGDGKTDVAAYLPTYGLFAFRPSSGGSDVVVRFGTAGIGNSIFAPGDYDGDGVTDLAVFLPASGNFVVRPSSGSAEYTTQFGFAGAAMTIPAPGDYDGDGKTDVAAYLPSLGILAYRSSAGTGDVLTRFGVAGAQQSIPAPGDYDGDGKTDIAVFIPGQAVYAYRPSSGTADVVRPFGVGGSGGSIPAPGDYDGDGRTDIAVFIPGQAVFAYRPSSGGADVAQSFGARGTGQTIPAPSIPYAQPAGVAAGAGSSALLASSAASTPIALTDDLVSALTGTAGTKKKATSLA